MLPIHFTTLTLIICLCLLDLTAQHDLYLSLVNLCAAIRALRRVVIRTCSNRVMHSMGIECFATLAAFRLHAQLCLFDLHLLRSGSLERSLAELLFMTQSLVEHSLWLQ